LASFGARARSLRITFAIASATTASVPGLSGSHSSAFIPVSDIRGANMTCFAITPS